MVPTFFISHFSLDYRSIIIQKTALVNKDYAKVMVKVPYNKKTQKFVDKFRAKCYNKITTKVSPITA
jgi:hypothetical protein